MVLPVSQLKSKHDTYFAVELSSDPDEFRCDAMQFGIVVLSGLELGN